MNRVSASLIMLACAAAGSVGGAAPESSSPEVFAPPHAKHMIRGGKFFDNIPKKSQNKKRKQSRRK